jgi:hypothetical protein
VILYTIIPDEFIFENRQEDIASTNLKEVDYMGERVQVMQTEGNRYVISRLISTSPKAYLNPKLQPGAIVEI